MIKLFFAETENAKAQSEEFTRKILGTHLNVDGNKIVMLKNDFGKANLRDYPDIHYNISHTKGAVVCAVADKPVGVDIERVKPFNRRIVERFFKQNEREYIFASEENQKERFFEIWTKKEAYVKWLGKGMEVPFESFDVLSNVNETILITQLFKYNYISVCSESIDLLDIKIETCSINTSSDIISIYNG